MIVEIQNETRRRTPRRRLRRITKRAEHLLSFPRTTHVFTAFVTDRTMRRLNRRTRYTNQPTDVLAFPLNRGRAGGRRRFTPDPDGRVRLGDIVISLETAERQAAEHAQSITTEVCQLFAHGLLHLAGYDHATRRAFSNMERMARRLLG